MHAAVLVLTVMVTPAAQEAPTDESSAIPQIEPSQILRLPFDGSLAGPITTNDDGSIIYGTHVFEAVNVWAVIVSYWIELLVIPLFLIWLILARNLWRTHRDRLAVGQPYCRRCKYSLIGIAQDTCPECGADLTRRRSSVIGRSRTWRYVFVLLLLLVLPAGWFALRVAELPRTCTWADRQHWVSHRLTGVLQFYGIDTDAAECSVLDLVAYDVKRQRIARRFDRQTFARPQTSVANASASLFVQGCDERLTTPDGAYLIDGEQGEVRIFDAQSGESIATISLPALRIQSFSISRDGRTMYGAVGIADVRAWRIPDGADIGSVDVEVVRPMVTATNPDDPPFDYVWSHTDHGVRVYVLPALVLPLRAISPDGHTVYSSVGSGLQMQRLQPPADYSLSKAWGGVADPMAMTVTHDGRFVLAPIVTMNAGQKTASRIEAFDHEEEALAARFTLPASVQGVWWSATSRDDRRLFVCAATSKDKVLIVYEMDAITLRGSAAPSRD